MSEVKHTPCSMGVGCDEYGVCYAEAHERPEQCARDKVAQDDLHCELLRALENIANAASATPGFVSPMFLRDARAAIAKAKGDA